ncbi:MAG: hypothetical protein AAF572_08340 [Cyanobacteria bacterium P01_B01_bin.77]
MTNESTKFILYACPVGELGQQLETYFKESLERCGANTAHQYMPHCTLTGFFEDKQQAAMRYVAALKSALAQQLPQQPIPVAEIRQLSFHENWHGLELTAPWFQSVAQTFASLAKSPSPLRLKTWLHVSLAYGFDPTLAKPLKQMALHIVDPQIPVDWELRLYQRQSNWHCHYYYLLTSVR